MTCTYVLWALRDQFHYNITWSAITFQYSIKMMEVRTSSFLVAPVVIVNRDHLNYPGIISTLFEEHLLYVIFFQAFINFRPEIRYFQLPSDVPPSCRRNWQYIVVVFALCTYPKFMLLAWFCTRLIACCSKKLKALQGTVCMDNNYCGYKSYSCNISARCVWLETSP